MALAWILGANAYLARFYEDLGPNKGLKLIVVAPPAFVGLLNTVLDHPTVQLITDRFEKDDTKSSEPQLKERLGACPFL
jgi:hypothetical protein